MHRYACKGVLTGVFGELNGSGELSLGTGRGGAICA
jgi:hypothetical protein